MLNGPGVEKGIARIYFKKIHRDVSTGKVDKRTFIDYLKGKEYEALCSCVDEKRTGDLGRRTLIRTIGELSPVEGDAYLLCVARRGYDFCAVNVGISERH